MDKGGAAETFWERYLANYRFRRLFGKEGRWSAFLGALQVAWKNKSGPFSNR
jgi:hypothetical protein